MTRSEILQQADKAISGQRELDYGSPENNFSLIAKLWSAYLGETISPVDVSMMMCLLKIARIKNGGGTGDSFVDLAGYAACGCELRTSEEQTGQVPNECTISGKLNGIPEGWYMTSAPRAVDCNKDKWI